MLIMNSSLSIFWLSDHAQNNWRRGSGETMNTPNDILLFPRSLVFSCFVYGRLTRISKVSYSLDVYFADFRKTYVRMTHFTNMRVFIHGLIKLWLHNQWCAKIVQILKPIQQYRYLSFYVFVLNSFKLIREKALKSWFISWKKTNAVRFFPLSRD